MYNKSVLARVAQNRLQIFILLTLNCVSMPSSIFLILCIHNFGGFQEKIGKSAEMICPISFYRWAPSLLDHFRKMDEAPFFLWVLVEVPKYHHTIAHWPFQSFNPKLDTEQKRGSAILQQKIL